MSIIFATGTIDRDRPGLTARLATIVQAYLDPTLRPLLPDIRDLRRRLPAQFDAQPLPDFLTWLTPLPPTCLASIPTDYDSSSTLLPFSTVVLPSVSACAAPCFAITSSTAPVCLSVSFLAYASARPKKARGSPDTPGTPSTASPGTSTSRTTAASQCSISGPLTAEIPPQTEQVSVRG